MSTRPAGTRTEGGAMPSADSNVIVLPDPDSPTTARVLPADTESDTLSTSRAGPRGVCTSVTNPCTSSTTPAAAPVTGVPASPGFGSVLQGFIETSNVNVVSEITNLITAQRAYEMNSKVITTSDQMLSTLTNLR